jgi:hypothetical protein
VSALRKNRVLIVLAASAAAAGLVAGLSSWDAARGEPAGRKDRIPPADRPALRGRIAYSARGAIWVMNANGTARRRLTRLRGMDFDPSLSPDGRAVVFRTPRGRYLPDPNGSGAEGIFVVEA